MFWATSTSAVRWLGPIVEYHHYLLIGVALAEFLQEHLKANTVRAWQVQTERLSGGRLDFGIQLAPSVFALNAPRRPDSLGTVTPPVPIDEPKARLVKRVHSHGFVLRGVSSSSSLATFFESLLLLWVSFLMARAPGFGLDPVTFEEPEDVALVPEVNPLVGQEFPRLLVTCDLTSFHGLFEAPNASGVMRYPWLPRLWVSSTSSASKPPS